MGLKILFVTAELLPYSSVGGLAHVSHFLPKALLKLGVDVRIFTPKYGVINQTKYPMTHGLTDLHVPTGEKEGSQHPTELICNIATLKHPLKSDPQVYFLENMEYYEQRANVYSYSDDHIRFGLLSRAALEFIKESDFVPDVIHVNDWHTGYITNLLKTEYSSHPKLKDISTVLSIHNLYQGMYDFDHAPELDFDDGSGPLDSLYSERFFKQNALKRGMINADIINTVSETYSREILTEQYAGRLSNVFKELRNKLHGVLNGLDNQSFNPKTDKIIKRRYSSSNLAARAENKTALQKEFSLTVDPHIPLLAIYGRLEEQKGIDLLKETLDFILSECKVQLVVLGTGDDRYLSFFSGLEKKYPGQVGTHLMFSQTLPRKIISGADMLLVPSRYEPGGIVALEALRYGCVPIVRATGGLADSVTDYDPSQNHGTGFSFKTYSGMSFLVAVVRALETYRNQGAWKKIVQRAMNQDFSWVNSAKKYIELYRLASDHLPKNS